MTAFPNHTPSETRIPAGAIVVRVSGQTDVGRAREHNEDAFAVADLTTGNPTLGPEPGLHVAGERGVLFMVADGMGGAAAGELASSMAVSVVLEEMRERWCGEDAPPPEPATFAAALREATEAANRRIHDYAAAHPENRGMGTTATVVGLLGDTLYVAQVGDSRAYLVREGTARQITKDQSLMQKLIEAGEMTEAEAEVSDRRNIILQALGPEPYVRTDLTHQQVRRGDTLVLCSDGLSGQVRAEEIARLAGETDDIAVLCERLIEQANATGGPDNITVVAARFDGAGLDAPEAADAVGHQVYPIGGEATPVDEIERYVQRSHEMPAATRPATVESVAAASPRPTGRAYLYVALFALLLAAAYLALTRLW